MNSEAPLRGPRETSGRRHKDRSSRRGTRGLIDRLELLPRLSALLDEIELLDADVDVPRTLAEGLYDDVAEAYADEVRAERRQR